MAKVESSKYLKLASDGIQTSDDLDPKSFTSVFRVTKSSFIINNLFRLFLGNESLEDVITRIIIQFLSNWFEFNEEEQTLTFKKKVKCNKTIEVDGTATINSEIYCTSNLSVCGQVKFEDKVIM
jgi:hypothetical protein